jgi:prevent-host-death family protein
MYKKMYTSVQIELGGSNMKTVTFTQFRQRASGLLSEVEAGENLLVLRHGKPIAAISPVPLNPETIPSWKRRGLRLTSKGAALSSAIIGERRGEDIL